MYVLYGGPLTRALINEMVMIEGGIDYELRPIDIIAGEHREPEFLAVNPAGRVPALITPDGETLYETPAINVYLAERHGLTDLAPTADEPERGRFLSALFYLTDELEPAMKRYFYPHRYVFRDEDTPAMKALALDTALGALGIIDGRLKGDGPYHLGGRFSLADLTLAFWAAFLDTGDTLAPCPAVERCMDLVRSRPKLRPLFDTLEGWHSEQQELQARGD